MFPNIVPSFSVMDVNALIGQDVSSGDENDPEICESFEMKAAPYRALGCDTQERRYLIRTALLRCVAVMVVGSGIAVVGCTTGIHQHQNWYPGLTASSPVKEFQVLFAAENKEGCTFPCLQDSVAPKVRDTMVTDMPCTDQETCLTLIDAWVDAQPRTNWMQGGAAFVQTFGANSQGGGSCGNEFCKLDVECPDFSITGQCRFDTYDNALAAIYLTKRGRFDKAKAILDAFIQLLYPDRTVPDVSFGPSEGLPSGRQLTLLAASYTPTVARAGEYWGAGVADGAVDVGNNAWVGMAFAHYGADAGQPCYALVARDILKAITSRTACDDGLKGYMARLPPYEQYYRSIEHNIDMYAFARMLNDADAKQRAGTFVNAMYGYSLVETDKEVYAVGTDGRHACDNASIRAAIPVDGATWNMLAEADAIAARKLESLKHAIRQSSEGGFFETDIDEMGNANGVGAGDTVSGFRFSSNGDGIQWENTAAGVMALIKYRNDYPGAAAQLNNLDHGINTIRDSVRSMLAKYGSTLASVLGGNMKAYLSHDRQQRFPGGSDTGLGWTYLRYPHLSATMWTGMLLMMQADDSQSVNASANPYAPPVRPIPNPFAPTASANVLACLPPAGNNVPSPGPSPQADPEAANGEASCQAHLRCAGLQGDCCPTLTGAMLGCC